MPKIIDRTGQRFGKLLVVERAASEPGRRGVHWCCACDCGGQRVVPAGYLRRAARLSCGCDRRAASELPPHATCPKAFKRWVQHAALIGDLEARTRAEPERIDLAAELGLSRRW